MAASEVLRQARKAAGLNQAELGMALGYPEETAQKCISNWETGYRPIPRRHIKALAALLHVELADLL